MEIQELSQGAVVLLRPVGPLVADDAESFRNKAVTAVNTNLGRVVVDASDIPYIDSRGIESLLDVTEGMGDSGEVLKICCSNPTVRQALELTGWASAFEFFDDVNSAVRSFL